MFWDEGDFGLVEFAGAAESARATEVLHTLHAQWAAAGIVNSFFGRQLPGLVLALGLESFDVAVSTQTGRPGQPAYEAMRLAWPNLRAGFAATGTAEDDLRCIDIAVADSAIVIGITDRRCPGQAAAVICRRARSHAAAPTHVVHLSSGEPVGEPNPRPGRVVVGDQGS